MTSIYEKQEEAKVLAEDQSKKCSDRMVSGLLTAISSTPFHEGSVSKGELEGMSWVIFECWNYPLPLSKISKEMGKHMRFEETPEGFEWKVTKK